LYPVYFLVDTKKLEQLQRATCRQFQCLPERTAAVAIYTLIGAEPIETTLDKNAMILFTTLAVFQIFSRTTGDIPDLACSPGPSKAYIVRLPILNLSSIFIFPLPQQ
jgi:hypothetical protein